MGRGEQRGASVSRLCHVIFTNRHWIFRFIARYWFSYRKRSVDVVHSLSFCPPRRDEYFVLDRDWAVPSEMRSAMSGVSLAKNAGGVGYSGSMP